jgi:hypothetical protein
MLCPACVERRLGRPLTPADLRNPGTEDELDPEDQTMREDDYGIIDSLTPAMLHAIDSAMIEFVASGPRMAIVLVRYILDSSPAAVAGLPDSFYFDRIGELVERGVLVVVAEGKDLRFHLVKAAVG